MPQLTPEQDRVDANSVAYETMASKWDLLHDLLGGTTAMRAASKQWLPQEEGEQQGDYKVRLNRSILYEAFRETIDELVSKPFGQPVTLDNCPETLQYLEKDADRKGTDITQCAKTLFKHLAIYGKAHLLVDFTTIVTNTNGGRASIAQEKAAGARAIFVPIAPPDLIGWRAQPDDRGVPTLMQVRIRESRVEPHGNYLDKEVEYVRIITPDGWELHKKNPDTQKYAFDKGGKQTFGGVYMITIYADPEHGFMTACPPLEGLAWLNLAHWQSDSDQRNILRIARCALLFVRGIEDDNKQVVISPRRTFKTKNPNAEMKYVEHSGAAIGAGRQDIIDLENRMEVMGLAPLMKKSAESTATGKAIDHAESRSAIQEWVRALETGLRQAFEYAARWTNDKLPDNFSVQVFSDFGIELGDIQVLDHLLRAAQASKLRDVTYHKELKRRKVMGDYFDPEEEAEELQNSGASLLGTMERAPGDPEPPADDEEDEAGPGRQAA